MSKSDKSQVIKNPERSVAESKKDFYATEHKRLKLTPKPAEDVFLGNMQSVPSAEKNDVKSRLPGSVIRQPYSIDTSNASNISSPALNVGNNLEHEWMGFDDPGFVDDLNIDYEKIIDNNDFIDVENNQIKSKIFAEKLVDEYKKTIALEQEIPQEDFNKSTLQEMSSGEYILLIGGTIFTSGDKEFILKTVNDLIFGSHTICNGSPIDVDELCVLKKIDIKIGVFLD